MTPTTTPRNTILTGDAATQLALLESSSIDCAITSPPYFRLRDYQHHDQLGAEDHIDQWVAHLRPVMAQLARVLVPTGTAWLNLGDTYSTHRREGAPRKSLLLGPDRLALALLEDGWIVRNKIIWAKANTRPSSVTDRLSCTHEVIYLLSRRPRYFFDLDAIRQTPVSRQPSPRPGRRAHQPRGSRRPPGAPGMPAAWRGRNADGDHGLQAMKRRRTISHPLGKNPGDVWRMSVSGYRGAHFATYPEHLVERILLAACPQQRCTTCRAPYTRPLRRHGTTATRLPLRPTCHCRPATSQPGIVIDPFLGSGTTAVTAERLDRHWLGIEINPGFVHLAQERIEQARLAPIRRPHHDPGPAASSPRTPSPIPDHHPNTQQH